VSWGIQESLKTELIENVKRQKSRFTDLSVEISVFTWADKQRTKLETTEHRRVLQWQGRLYDCVCKNSPHSRANSTAFQFNWNDGEQTTGYFPPDHVTIHRGKHEAIAYFEPYDTILNAIGAEKTLLEFLNFEGKTMDAWKLELVNDDAKTTAPGIVAAPNIVSLCAVRQLPGSKFASVIELKLSKDHAYLPVWGQTVEVVSNVRHVRAVAEVTDFMTIEDCGPLFKQYQVSTYQDDNAIVTTSLVELQAERLMMPPQESIFHATSFVGNPEVIKYLNDRETRREKYRPIRVKKPEPWPPFTIWLVMNDIIAGVVGLALLVRFIIHRLNASVDGRKES